MQKKFVFIRKCDLLILCCLSSTFWIVRLQNGRKHVWVFVCVCEQKFDRFQRHLMKFDKDLLWSVLRDNQPSLFSIIYRPLFSKKSKNYETVLKILNRSWKFRNGSKDIFGNQNGKDKPGCFLRNWLLKNIFDDFVIR